MIEPITKIIIECENKNGRGFTRTLELDERGVITIYHTSPLDKGVQFTTRTIVPKKDPAYNMYYSLFQHLTLMERVNTKRIL